MTTLSYEGETLALRALSPVLAGRAVRYCGDGYVTPGHSHVIGVTIHDAAPGEDVRVLVSGTLRVLCTYVGGRPCVMGGGIISNLGRRLDWLLWERPGVLRLFPPFEGDRGRTVRAILRESPKPEDGPHAPPGEAAPGDGHGDGAPAAVRA